MLFQQAEGETAVLVSRGTYRQCDLYTRGDSLYAKIGNGFVRLYADCATSRADTRLDFLAYDGPLYADKLGRLRWKAHDSYRLLEDSKIQIEDKT